jgi:hypothetical protein
MRDELRKSDLGAVHVVSGDAGFNARRQWRSGLYNPCQLKILRIRAKLFVVICNVRITLEPGRKNPLRLNE